jgi:hypothetical protein
MFGCAGAVASSVVQLTTFPEPTGPVGLALYDQFARRHPIPSWRSRRRSPVRAGVPALLSAALIGVGGFSRHRHLCERAIAKDYQNCEISLYYGNWPLVCVENLS